MASINRTIESEQDRVMAARLIENRTLPFTLSLTDGKHRSTAQNRLQHMWMKEISEQLGDMTEHYARAYCKLTIGVPILRAQNEAFRLRYDEIIRPLPYEQKIAIMMEPLDFTVTRLMSVKQKTEYLEGIIRHFGEKGIVLTMPEEVRQELRMNHETENTNTDDAGSSLASTEETGAGEASTPGPVSSSLSNHLQDFARKGFKTLSDDIYEDAKTSALDMMIGGYQRLIDTGDITEADWPKFESIVTAFKAVFAGKRTVQQGREFAAEVIGCKINQIGG